MAVTTRVTTEACAVIQIDKSCHLQASDTRERGFRPLSTRYSAPISASASDDDTPLCHMSEKSADSAHDHTNHAGDTELERRSLHILEIHEQPKTVAVACAKTQHHVLPVGTLGELVEEQVDAKEDEQFEGSKGSESNDRSRYHA